MLVSTIWAELSTHSLLEIIAVVALSIYVVLAARNNRFCWPAAFLGSSLFVYILWQNRLLMDSALNVYYALMAIYGWISWQRQAPPTARQSGITYWPTIKHAVAITSILILSLISGNWLTQHTDASLPYLDSIKAWGGILATWLLARRKIESWIYWIILDVLSIYIYVNSELYFTTLLFIIYIVTSLYAYFHWRKLLADDRQLTSESLQTEPIEATTHCASRR